MGSMEKITSCVVDNTGCANSTVNTSICDNTIVVLIILLIVIRCLFPNIKPVIASNVACLMFNARSLCNKLVELHYLLYSSKFDILLVTESWLRAGITNGLLDPESKFTVLRHDRSITSG